jgi:hypothetical protein
MQLRRPPHPVGSRPFGIHASFLPRLQSGGIVVFLLLVGRRELWTYMVGLISNAAGLAVAVADLTRQAIDS